MKGNNTTCCVCSAILDDEHLQYFDDRVFCEDCFERSTVACDNCGETIWRENAEGDSNYTLCRRCYDDSYSNCERCGRLIHNDDAYYEDDNDFPYCHDCFELMNKNPIKNYNYKPEPIFYGSGSSLFYGVELEVDKGGEDSENAQILLNVANKQKNHIYIKHDGSLHDGFEIVSHPMTLDYHTKNMNWYEIFEKAVEMGYLSHSTFSCGLHAHVNRSAFGINEEEQEHAIGRVVYFVEKHWNELVRFSRRTLDSLDHWAAKYATISPTTSETYEKAKGKRLGRYVAVNLENTNTIEFRLFRGTLRYKTFIAALQLVDEICNFAIVMNDREMENMSWSEFVSRISPKKAELIEYLKEKRLYVNDIQAQTEGVEE